MAMPRPSGEALEIAEKVIPGLKRHKKTSQPRKAPKASLSDVEIAQTNNMDNKEGSYEKGTRL